VRKFLRIFQALVVVIGSALAWIYFHPSPERVIRGHMDLLQKNLSVKPGEGNFARVAAINRILTVFAPNVQINTEGMPHISETISGHAELQQALFAARTQLQGEVKFYEVHIVVGPEQTNAVVNFTAAARLANQPEPYSQDLKARFQKIENKWLIVRVDPIGAKDTAQ